MERAIVHDPIFLARASTPATPEDASVADDLADTLLANREKCVGMAANMIGVSRRIIVFFDEDKLSEMFNPVVLSGKMPFEAEEGCLSLDGVRRVKRYKSIRVQWQTRTGEKRIKTFVGWTAQIIQHEVDHCNGILI